MCGGGGGGGRNREAEEAAERRHEEQMQFQRDQMAEQTRQFNETMRINEERYQDSLEQIKASTGGGGAPPANPIAQVAPPPPPAVAQARMPNATADPLYNSSAAAPQSLAIAPRRLQAGSGRRRFRNPVNVAGGAGGLNIPA